MQRWAATLAALLLLTLAWGCSAPEPQPLLFNSAPWQDGETSVYRVTDRNGRPAGTTQYTIAQTADDGWTILRNTAAQGVQETIVVALAGTGFRPRTSSLVRTEDGRTERLSAVYAGGKVDMQMTNRRDITTSERVSIPSDSRDQWTLFMLVRALPLQQGYTTRLNVFLPVMGRQSRVTLTTTGVEQITVPAGTYDAWHVTLDFGNTQSELWVGVDPPHPLVRYIDGANQGVFELDEFATQP